MSSEKSQLSLARAAAGEPPMLASESDRDHAADLLNAAFAAGRLTADEHGERVRAVFAARTWQQLRQLTADLPGEGGAAAEISTAAILADPDRCLLCVLLIMCPPAGIAWLVLSRHRSRARSDRRLGSR